MSGITGSDARKLIKAYNSLYAPQEEVELTEEQVQEDFENWVNSLVEEGHDLSEFTWEEMYEAYIGEDIKSFADRGGLLGAAQRAFARSGTEQGKAQNRAAVGRFFGDINRGATKLMQTGGIFGRGGAVDRALRKPTTSPAGDGGGGAPSSTPGENRGPGGSDGGTGSRQTDGATAGSATGAPGGTAPSTKPADVKLLPSKPVGSAMDQWRANFPKLAAKVTPTGTQRGTGQSVMAKQADDLRKLRPAATETGPKAQSTLPGGAYSPAATAKMTQRTRNILGVKEQHDAYDIVLEYLLSEGHVDTVDEAHYVMLQMDAGYIQSIVEQSNTLVTPEQRRADELKYGAKRTTQVPPPKPPSVKTKPETPRMPL